MFRVSHKRNGRNNALGEDEGPNTEVHLLTLSIDPRQSMNDSLHRYSKRFALRQKPREDGKINREDTDESQQQQMRAIGGQGGKWRNGKCAERVSISQRVRFTRRGSAVRENRRKVRPGFPPRKEEEQDGRNQQSET